MSQTAHQQHLKSKSSYKQLLPLISSLSLTNSNVSLLLTLIKSTLSSKTTTAQMKLSSLRLAKDCVEKNNEKFNKEFVRQVAEIVEQIAEDSMDKGKQAEYISDTEERNLECLENMFIMVLECVENWKEVKGFGEGNEFARVYDRLKKKGVRFSNTNKFFRKDIISPMLNPTTIKSNKTQYVPPFKQSHASNPNPNPSSTKPPLPLPITSKVQSIISSLQSIPSHQLSLSQLKQIIQSKRTQLDTLLEDYISSVPTFDEKYINDCYTQFQQAIKTLKARQKSKDNTIMSNNNRSISSKAGNKQRNVAGDELSVRDLVSSKIGRGDGGNKEESDSSKELRSCLDILPKEGRDMGKKDLIVNNIPQQFEFMESQDEEESSKQVQEIIYQKTRDNNNNNNINNDYFQKGVNNNERRNVNNKLTNNNNNNNNNNKFNNFINNNSNTNNNNQIINHKNPSNPNTINNNNKIPSNLKPQNLNAAKLLSHITQSNQQQQLLYQPAQSKVQKSRVGFSIVGDINHNIYSRMVLDVKKRNNSASNHPNPSKHNQSQQIQDNQHNVVPSSDKHQQHHQLSKFSRRRRPSQPHHPSQQPSTIYLPVKSLNSPLSFPFQSKHNEFYEYFKTSILTKSNKFFHHPSLSIYKDTYFITINNNNLYSMKLTFKLSAPLPTTVGSLKTSFTNTKQIDIWIKPITKVSPLQYEQELIINWNSFPLSFIEMSVTIQQLLHITCPLPLLYFNFLKIGDINPDKFNRIFQNQSHRVIKSSILPLNKNIITEMKDFEKYLPGCRVGKVRVSGLAQVEVSFLEQEKDLVLMSRIVMHQGDRMEVQSLELLGEWKGKYSKELNENLVFLFSG